MDLLSVSLTATGRAVAVGTQATLLDWKLGVGWKIVTMDPTMTSFTSVYGISPTNVWIAASDGTTRHYDGTVLPSAVFPCGAGIRCGGEFLSIWVSPLGVPWVAGRNNLAYKATDANAASWVQLAVPGQATQSLSALFGLGGGDVWLGEDAGILYHFNGMQFAPYMAPGTPAHGIWGAATNNVWAVGANAYFEHYNGSGTAWMPVMAAGTGTATTLWSITGNNAGELWVVGSAGLILYYDGAAWHPQVSPVTQDLYGVSVRPDDSFPIAVGQKGVILRLACPG
jgi:hypothetical protein